MSNINQLVFESIKKKKMYRSGPVQNIKLFSPKKPIKTPLTHKSFKNKQLIYATDDIEYAAGFCFDWADDDGFKFDWVDKVNHQKPWVLEVPKKYKNRLNQKCSVYELENNTFKRIKVVDPEYYSIKPVKVIKEIKFKSCYDCLKKYGVVLKVI
jgi:hypothetical protein